jgi:predicted RNA-binding Zn-ribbon protein involved in translation (DUF1610 family)
MNSNEQKEVFCISCGNFLKKLRLDSKNENINFPCGKCGTDFNLQKGDSGDYSIEIVTLKSNGIDLSVGNAEAPEIRCPFSSNPIAVMPDSSHTYQCTKCEKVFEVSYL